MTDLFETQSFRALGPFLAERLLVVGIELGIAGVLGNAPQELCFARASAELIGGREDIQPSLAERFDDLARHALDFELAVFAGKLGSVADLFEIGAQRRVVDRSEDGVVLPDLAVPERLPVARLVLCHSRDDGVGMVLGV